MRKIAPVFILLLFLLSSIPFSFAQDTPVNIREAAISHYNGVFPGAGRPDGWRHLGPFTARDTALGCPLTVGTALPATTTAYQVFLTYDGAEYSYFISGDATIVVPCDPKFPGTGTGTTGTTTSAACTAASLLGDVNLFSTPANTSAVVGTLNINRWVGVIGKSADGQWYKVPNTGVGTAPDGWAHGSTLQFAGNCAGLLVVDGTAGTTACTAKPLLADITVFSQPVNNGTSVGSIPVTSTVYVLARTADNQWFLLPTVGVSTAASGWANVSVLQLAGNCAALPVSNTGSTTTTTTTAGCTVSSPQGNVRQSPSTSASIVGTLTVGIAAQAVGRTNDSSWYQIQFTTGTGTAVAGWIAAVASTASGTGCSALAVTGTATTDFGSCPADFSGYLAPRLTVGTQGRVQGTNNVSNRVRSQPTTTSPVIFEMRPNTVFDVIGGPQCGNGIVWWNVNQAGQTGWTAESNTRDSNSYYVEPVAPVTTGPDPGAQPQYATPANARITSGFILSGKFDLLDQLYGEGLGVNQYGDLAWSPDSRRVAITSVGAIRIYDISTKTNADPALEAAMVVPGVEPTAIAYSPDGIYLVVGYSNGDIRLALLGTGGSGTALPSLAAHANTEIADAVFSPDGRYLLTISGYVPASTPPSPPDYSVRVWDVDSLNVRTGEMTQVFNTTLDVPPLDATWTLSGTPVVITTDDVRAYNMTGGETYRRGRNRGTVGAVTAADPSWDTTSVNNQNLVLYSDSTFVLLADVTNAGAQPTPIGTMSSGTTASGIATLGPQQVGFDTPVLAAAIDASIPEGQGVAIYTPAAQTSVRGFPIAFIRALEFSPNGMYLAVLSDNTVIPPTTGIAPGLWLFGATQ